MRVITIIVHLIAQCDPALHETTEEAAHPSLPNKRGVNFALHLSFSFLQLSLEAFYSISSLLRVLATMPRPGMHGLRFAFFVSISLIIFRNFNSIASLCETVSVYNSFPCLQFPLLSCYPPPNREPLWPH